MSVSARRWFMDPMPSGATVRKADVMLAKSDRGECRECERKADDEDGLCLWCRRAAKEN